jgi:PPM family protein phosphatase
MSFLSKLFRGNDQPPATEAPPAHADDQPDVEPAVEVEAEQQASDGAENAALPAQTAQDELPWWEKAASEPAPQADVMRSANGGTAPLAAEPEVEAHDVRDPDTPPEPLIAPITDAARAEDTAEEEGTRPLTAADMPALVALRSRRGLAASAQRDIGRVRSINQDSVFALITTLPRESSDVTVGLFIVADGMGGHDGGEVASRLAVTTVARHVLSELVLPALEDNVTEALQPLIIAAVQDANRAIWEHAQAVGSDMGTTCTVVLLLGHALYIGHVGDSRAYLATPTRMRPLTSDHSAVGRLIQVGQLDPAEAREHPLRSQLYRTVGQQHEVAVDFIYQPVGDATHLLICSDGLWGMLDDEIILDVLHDSFWPQDASRELIARANLAGGDDNISALVVTLPTPDDKVTR